MKYYITHTCGHRMMHQLFGPTANREEILARLETEECDDCRAERIKRERAERKAEAEAAAQKTPFAAVLDVPLRGSPKQVAWAEGIRSDAVAKAARAAEDGIIKPEAVQIFVDAYSGLKESRWWIDHRGDAGKSFAVFASNCLQGAVRRAIDQKN